MLSFDVLLHHGNGNEKERHLPFSFLAITGGPPVAVFHCPVLKGSPLLHL